MFDERDYVWLDYYKLYIVVMFWLYIVAAAAGCICGWCGVFWLTDSYFLDGIIALIGGLIIAATHLICNMVVLNFFTNVQSIRIEIENKSSEQKTNTVSSENKSTVHIANTSPVFRDQQPNYGKPVFSSAPEGMWACKQCGTHNSTNYAQCKKCGAYR